MTFIAIFGLGYIFCPKAIFCPNTKNKGGEGQGKGDPAGDKPARDQTQKALSEAQTNGTSRKTQQCKDSIQSSALTELTAHCAEPGAAK